MNRLLRVGDVVVTCEVGAMLKHSAIYLNFMTYIMICSERARENESYIQLSRGLKKYIW